VTPSDAPGPACEAPRFLTIDEVVSIRPNPEATRSRLKLHGLWVVGSIEALATSTVAIVGSRAPSEAGRRLAERIAREVAAAGVCVVSGLALGIDGSAHAGALEAGGATIGVLGGGHRQFFPPRNAALAARMAASGGGVISPYPPDAVARPFQFLQRNAVVAALVDAVLVVEAATRSGALSTASWASDFSVPVLAVPGDVDRAKAAGCNALIRDGATLVRDADDVLAALGVERVPDAPRAASKATRIVDALPYARDLLLALTDEPRDVETLAAVVDAPIGVLLGTLLRLELLGAIVRDGPLYALTDRPG